MSRLNPPEPNVPGVPELELDPIFKNQMTNLYRLHVYGRWSVIGLLWLTVGACSLWQLSYPISLIQEQFTWAAVKYGLMFQPLPAFGLCLCVGVMTGTLVWQSRNMLWGVSKKERQQLIKQVSEIRKQGDSHPLWKWVVKVVDN
ncbi:hypothetical protein [Chamaesiphon sp. VAR_69_metabat_338]|uniref:hypothetical protein n=1 Tax=Chamaesiphon sp. VAR_69_metabat_338 TaxID=2964704 RepID=UPI00286DFDEF|nr:hypothetical protein [Chamaesiphon sp. VAR_69_metabat_338]